MPAPRLPNSPSEWQDPGFWKRYNAANTKHWNGGTCAIALWGLGLLAFGAVVLGLGQWFHNLGWLPVPDGWYSVASGASLIGVGCLVVCMIRAL